MTTYTGGFTTPGTSAEINLVLVVTVSSQSISANTSTVAWNFYMDEYVNANPFNNNGNSSASATVGSVVFSSSTLSYNFDGTNEDIGIASGSVVIAHNADGTKSITVGGSYNGGNPIGTASFSNTFVLPTIPRNRLIVGDAGVHKTAEVYVDINGVRYMGQPYVGDAGVWKLLDSTP